MSRTTLIKWRKVCTPVAVVAAVIGIMAVSPSPAESGDQIALIVNKTSPVLALTANDLKSIYLGEKERWPNGQKVTPVALSGPELKAFLKVVCGMSEPDYKKYFIQANFTGKTLVLPRIATSAAAAKALVSSTPGAIGFVRAADLDASVGTVRFNGSAPGDPGYKLTAAQ